MTHEEFKNKYLKKSYLGDGLYVHFDGFSFILSTERENGEHYVGLEPDMLESLFFYRNGLYEDLKTKEKG